MASLYEISHERMLRRGPGLNEWHGRRSFICNSSDTVYYTASLRGQLFPGTSGTSAPVCKTVTAHYEPTGLKDIAMLICEYAPMNGVGGFIRYPNKARITVLSSSQAMPIEDTKDLDGKVIAGWAEDAQGYRVYYHVVDGRVIKEEGPIVLVIKTAAYADGFNRNLWMALKNKVNRSTVNILGAGAETVRFQRVDLEQTYGDDIVRIDIYAEYEPKGWNSILVQAGTLGVESIPVFSNGVDTRDIAQVPVWLPDKIPVINTAANTVTYKESPKESRRWYETVDTSVLNALTVW